MGKVANNHDKDQKTCGSELSQEDPEFPCLLPPPKRHFFPPSLHPKVFPDSSVGKESTCNAGDPGSIPGSGRSAGEG